MTGPGRLVLKGGLSISSASSKRGSGAEDAKKTKKKKRKRKMKDEEEGEGNEETKQDIDEMQAAQTMQTTHMRLDTYGGMKHQFDRRTPAEKRFDAVQAAREKQTIEKLATKTHKDRVNEFNEKLVNLSEHYDIPKVGPG